MRLSENSISINQLESKNCDLSKINCDLKVLRDFNKIYNDECYKQTPYEKNDAENFTVSVKYDANGGIFTTNTSFFSKFKITQSPPAPTFAIKLSLFWIISVSSLFSPPNMYGLFFMALIILSYFKRFIYPISML